LEAGSFAQWSSSQCVYPYILFCILCFGP
jgi:hypothetical protein